ncbi:DNA polymerase beta superfamily protein [Flavobacterium sp. I3-2]|uniref:nucleotidyltransferase domain-containing protein n=1 Tax=Flavobacterium sp. I3-2 TaxID=2748319 RepID=UPI0015ADEEC4|nr:nucleotidyltransferase domain-containing protein [Flavobacterium sp. I3-2]
MKTIIQNKIKELESEHHIKILFALESGSRAWGFSSTDSDYDVRFIYVRPLNEYLKIDSAEDFFDFPINNELDLNGWDLKKFFKLLYASNATTFEWMQSPIFYQKETFFYYVISDLLPKFYCQQTLMHHYLGLVKKRLDTLNAEEIKLKNLFYILRSLLSAKYCSVKNVYPPMEFKDLIFLIDDEKISMEIEKLRLIKAEVTESYITSISNELFLYITSLFEDLSKIDKTKTKGLFDVALLNTTYLKLLQDANDRFFKGK